MNAQSAGNWWYTKFRAASYVSILGALIWTIALILPFKPFNEMPPTMVGGGPGEWLVIGYLLYIILGAGAFAWLSGMLHLIEKEEGRILDPSLMWPGFSLLFFGTTVTCIALGYAGASGGYDALNGGTSTLHQLLSPYLYPLSATTVVAVTGALLVLLAMVRARGP